MTAATRDQTASGRVDKYQELGSLLVIRALLLVRVTWLPIVAYLGSMLLHLSLLRGLMSPDQSWGDTIVERLTAWDGRLFLDVAEHGYPGSFTYHDGKLTGNNLAFLPLFPSLTHVVHLITGLDYQMSSLVVAHLSFIVAMVALNTLVRSLYGRRVATISVVLLAFAQPMGIVFLMGYSESLFVALAMCSLLAIRHRHWVIAGIMCSLAGLTRPAGVAVSVALLTAVTAHLVEIRKMKARPLIGLVIGLIGLPSYIIWVGLRVGPLNAWFVIQDAGWGTKWDNGASTLDFIVHAFTKGDGWVMISTAILVPIIMSITLNSWRGTWNPFVMYGVMIVVMTIGQSNYYHCKLRLLLPTIVIVIPIARVLARASRSTRVISITMAAISTSWYGAYMLTVWHYAI